MLLQLLLVELQQNIDSDKVDNNEDMVCIDTLLLLLAALGFGLFVAVKLDRLGYLVDNASKASSRG